MRVHRSNSRIFIIKRSKVFAFDLFEILYIERISNKSVIQLLDREITVNLSLAKIKEYLPNNFIRGHKSFIINKDKITELNTINTNTVECLFSGDKSALITKETVEAMIT